MKPVLLVAFAVLIVLLMAACGGGDFEPQGEAATAIPTSAGGTTGGTEPANIVSASDQVIAGDNLVRLDRVKLAQNGYVVIRMDNGGTPGDTVVGYNRYSAGDYPSVSFTIDGSLLSTGANALWAVLHTDAGTDSVFEFPGADIPLTNTDGTPVADSFIATK